jgi:hypothetical protein
VVRIMICKPESQWPGPNRGDCVGVTVNLQGHGDPRRGGGGGGGGRPLKT